MPCTSPLAAHVEHEGRELRIVLGPRLFRPAGEIEPVLPGARQDLLDEPRGLQQAVERQRGAAHGVVAHPGAGAMVAQLEAPAAHHVPLAAHQREADRARAGDDDAAVAAAEGAHAGGIGIIVDADAGKGQAGVLDLLLADGGDDPREAQARVEVASVFNPALPAASPAVAMMVSSAPRKS